MRSSQPLFSSPGHSPTSAGAQSDRLPVILENGDAAVPSTPPPRLSNRPFTKRVHLGDPPQHSDENPPPPYSVYASVLGPGGEKLDEVRNSKFIARRGGWRRLLLLTMLVLLVIVGLVVGLVVGLRKRQQRNESLPPPRPLPAATLVPGAPFPAGAYSFSPFLENVTTNCTTNPTAWQCYPYKTYELSGAESMVTLNWVINPRNSDSSQFIISSTDNPFGPTFESVPLQLQEAGSASERYEFEVPMDLAVIPSGPLTEDNSLTRCFYNGTILKAELYTKRPKSRLDSASPLPSASPPASATSASIKFVPWPNAVAIEQVKIGAEGVPDCYKVRNGQITEKVPDGGKLSSLGGLCNCLYRN